MLLTCRVVVCTHDTTTASTQRPECVRSRNLARASALERRVKDTCRDAAVRASYAVVALCVAIVSGLPRAADAQDLSLPAPVGMAGDPAARLVLDGNAAFRNGDLPTAAADYRRALTRKPDFAVATFDLGLVEIHAGKRVAGLAHMDRGIALARAHGMSARDVGRLRSLRDAFSSQPVPA